MTKGTKSVAVSEATHKRIRMLKAAEGGSIHEWVERALAEAVDRAERKRAREEGRKRARIS